MIKLRPMEDHDWDAFAGAEEPSEGQRPLIGTINVPGWPEEDKFEDTDDEATIIVDKHGVEIIGGKDGWLRMDGSFDQMSKWASELDDTIDFDKLLKMGFVPDNFPKESGIEYDMDFDFDPGMVDDEEAVGAYVESLVKVRKNPRTEACSKKKKKKLKEDFGGDADTPRAAVMKAETYVKEAITALEDAQQMEGMEGQGLTEDEEAIVEEALYSLQTIESDLDDITGE